MLMYYFETLDPEQYPQDIVSWLLKAFVEKDVSASPSEDALHEDSRVIIIAGRCVLSRL